MKNLIPRTIDELMALSISMLALASWMIIWWRA